MCHAIIMADHTIRICQLVQVRSIGSIANYLVGSVILHHNVEDMLQGDTLWRSSWCDSWCDRYRRQCNRYSSCRRRGNGRRWCALPTSRCASTTGEYDEQSDCKHEMSVNRIIHSHCFSFEHIDALPIYQQ